MVGLCTYPLAALYTAPIGFLVGDNFPPISLVSRFRHTSTAAIGNIVGHGGL